MSTLQDVRADLPSASTDVTLIEQTLAGDPEAKQALVKRLLPIIEGRVVRRVGRGSDVQDLVQEVWLALFEQGGRKLRAYRPDRGATLEQFVGLITEREVVEMFRRRSAQKRGGHLQAVSTNEPRGANLELVTSHPGPEEQVVSKNLAARLWARLEKQLAPRGKLVFRLLYTDGLEPGEVARALGVNLQVVYNWQHKIRGLSRVILLELETGPSEVGAVQTASGEPQGC